MTASAAIFLEDAARVLLLVHALAAMAMAGASTHHAVLSWRALRGRSVPWRLVRLYTTVMLWAHLVTVVVGLLVYPAFRVHVRAATFDVQLPMATAVFEIKEHWSVIGLALVAWLWPMARRLGRASRGSDTLRAYAVVGLAMAAIVWMAMISGLVLVMIESV